MENKDYIFSFFLSLIIGFLIGLGVNNINRSSSKTIRKFTLSAGTFDMDVTVIVTEDTLYAANYIRENLDSTVVGADLDCRGATFGTVDGKSPIIWLPTTEDVSINNHELFHATMNIMQWAGVEYSDETEEVYAYQLQYLSNQFYNKIK